MSALAATTAARLSNLVGGENLISDLQSLERYAIDGLRPVAAARPASPEEVAEILRCAAADGLGVVPVGAATKLRMGMPPARYDLAVDLTRLTRVLAYDPADLTLSVESGIRLADLQRMLTEHNQFLPLAVPFARQATLGGILATNSSGPLRQFYGTARDFVLGMEFVTGEGVRAKSGGRVVKNVAGYDLHKLMIGALGSLGIITGVNLKTFPVPPCRAVFIASFFRPHAALQFRHAIAASPLQPHAVEIVDPGAAALLNGRGSQPPVLPAAEWSVVVAVGGNPAVIERHRRELEKLAPAAEPGAFAAFVEPPREHAESLICALQEFPAAALEHRPSTVLVRISTLPSELSALLEGAQAFARHHELPCATLLRGIGVLSLALFPPALGSDGMARLAEVCRELFETTAKTWRASAVIEWCPAELKDSVNVWGPPREDFSLMRKLKAAFDPRGVLNPGRFIGGI